MDRRPPPVVRVVDPARPGRPADVLVVGEDPAPPDPAVRRRRLRTAGIAALGAGLLLAGAQVREHGAAKAEERRLRGTVSLTSAPSGGSWGIDPVSGLAEVTSSLLLTNTGPGPVTVVGGSAGDLTVEEELVLATGRSGRLSLALSAPCPTDRPPDVAGEDVLALDVRTGAGVRGYELPLQGSAGQGLFARACGWAPLAESVVFTSTADPGAPGGAGIELQVGAESRVPVRLLALRTGSGVTLASAELAAGPVPLPPWEPGGTAVRSLRARLEVQDCAAASAAEQEGGVLVTGVFADRSGQQVEANVVLDAAQLRPRIAAACPSAAGP